MMSTSTQDDREQCNQGRDPTTSSYASTSRGTSTDPRSTQGDAESNSDSNNPKEARGTKRRRSPDPCHFAGSGVADREGGESKRRRRSRKASNVQGPEANADTTGDTNSEFQNPTSLSSSYDSNSRATSTDPRSTQGDADTESNSDSANPKEARGTKRRRSPDPCHFAGSGVADREGGESKRRRSKPSDVPGSEADVDADAEFRPPTSCAMVTATRPTVPRRHKSRWTDGEDLRLCEAYRRRTCIGHTADILGRTPGSILHRLAMHRTMGTIEPASARDNPVAPVNLLPTQKLNIYAFGTGDNAELGLGPEVNAKIVKRPRLNGYLLPETVGIVSVALGGMHGLALSHEGKVYSWGVNDMSALGRETRSTSPTGDVGSGNGDGGECLNPLESTPNLITAFPEGTVITNIAAGDSISVAVTDMGNVYAWGTFRVGLPCSHLLIGSNNIPLSALKVFWGSTRRLVYSISPSCYLHYGRLFK